MVRKKFMSLLIGSIMVVCLFAGCGSPDSDEALSTAIQLSESAEELAIPSGSGTAPEETGESDDQTEIQVFAAASLNTVLKEIITSFNKTYPKVQVTVNADSSGTLLTQIQNGYSCDVFFSAAQKQMDTLEKEDQLLINRTRRNVVNNQVCVITRKDSGTKVKGLETLKEATSIALADGSVPVGKYTRAAMVKAGILEKTDDPSKITTQQISDALGGVEISEQGNVSKVLSAVAEGSCEVGTTYYSDTYGYEDQIQILEKVSYDLSGNVIYPIAQVQNKEADEEEVAAAKAFIDFVTSDEAKQIFEKYYFDTNVE